MLEQKREQNEAKYSNWATRGVIAIINFFFFSFLFFHIFPLSFFLSFFRL